MKGAYLAHSATENHSATESLRLRSVVIPGLITLACGGILGVYFFDSYLFPAALLSCCILILLSMRSGRYPVTLSLTVFLVFLSLGIARGVFLAQNLSCDELCEKKGAVVSITGKVVQEPEFIEAKQKLILETKWHGHTLVTLPRNPSYNYGDIVDVEGKLKLPEDFTTEGGTTFRYSNLLRARGITTIVEGYRSRIREVNKGNKIIASLYAFKHFIARIIGGLPSPEGGLLFGMIFGGKNALPALVLNDFKIAGLIHIVVLSGENLTIIAMLATRFVRRRLGFISGVLISSGIVCAYAVMGGFEPATTRAMVMVLLLFAAILLKRKANMFRVLSVGALLLIVHNPLLLFDDPSFQLSLLALLGLLLVGPIIELWLTRKNFPLWLAPYISSIMGAQLGVLPFLLWSTQSITLYAILANLIVLFLVEILSVLGIGILTVGALLPSAFTYAAYPVVVILSVIIKIAHFIAALPRASIHVSTSGGVVALVYTIIALWLIVRWRNEDLAPLSLFAQKNEAKAFANNKIPWIPPEGVVHGIYVSSEGICDERARNVQIPDTREVEITWD